ncbi:MAG TPA: hypothetical protein VF407_14445, partial [Polyangiaceae bacterium]
LAKKPEERFASAADFAAAMQAVLGGATELPKGLSATPPPVTSIGGMPASGPMPISSPLPPVHSSTTSMTNAAPTIADGPIAKKKDDKLLLLVGVALGCLVVGAGLAVVAMRLLGK